MHLYKIESEGSGKNRPRMASQSIDSKLEAETLGGKNSLFGLHRI